ncbi:MAG: hypothetical protein Tp178MES00d2C33159851_139 [Prokaryotic dsDNA virus sp.]|nr:MAG: hypothetical protein Tp178MES00d2C33159851_139 [Prokaryotic dsDNA virus sp.]|tara:strand:+ start:11995 stop:12246 length:252 start_codon:yes stop_codon:yes gene_type:complete
MMMFKNKYVRSEWMEGFLWAENILGYYYEASEHLFVEDTSCLEGYKISGRGSKRDKPHSIKSFVGLEFGQGGIDYIEYKDTKL